MQIRIENQWSVSRQISSPCITYPCIKHSIVVFTLSISIAIPELSTAPMITIITSRGTPQSRLMPTRIEPRIRSPDKCPINALLTRPTKPYSTGSPRSLISQTGDSPYFSRLVFATMYRRLCVPCSGISCRKSQFLQCRARQISALECLPSWMQYEVLRVLVHIDNFRTM